jgi:general secretion pathway protein K
MGASNFTYAEASWTQALADCSGAAVLASGNLSSGIFHICTLLIVVLWTLVLIAFIVAHVTASGRTEIRIANNLTANAVALAAVDGAIYEAIFNLSDPRPDQRWPVDGNPRELLIGHTQVTLRLEDEAWWINPNSAAPALVEALLRVSGSDAESARRLANASNEWVGSAPAPRLANAVLAEYQAAGLDYGPPAAPIETLDELGRVVGMSPAVLAAIRPHLTLYGPPQPNAATADPIVAAALAAASRAEIAPSPLQPPPDVLTTRIVAAAFGPSNASLTRSAIVRFGAVLPSGYQVLAWGNRF